MKITQSEQQKKILEKTKISETYSKKISKGLIVVFGGMPKERRKRLM